MNYSSNAASLQVAILREMREFLERELSRIDNLLAEREYHPVEDDEGDPISWSDYSDSELRRK